MKFSMYTNFGRLVRENGFEKALKMAKEIGFSGVEIIDCSVTEGTMLIPTTKKAEEYRRLIAKEQMSVACYSVGLSLYNADYVTKALKMHAEIAASLGSPFLHHTLCLGSVDGVTYDEVLADVLPRAIEVANYAKSLGLTCIYEDQGLYFNGVESFGKFFAAIKEKCDNVGVCCDFGNILFADCGAAEFISAFKNDIKHVHFKDYLKLQSRDEREGNWHVTKGGAFLIGVPTGEGSVDFYEGLKLLKQAGYDGFFSAEQELPFPEPFISDTKKAMTYLKGLF